MICLCRDDRTQCSCSSRQTREVTGQSASRDQVWSHRQSNEVTRLSASRDKVWSILGEKVSRGLQIQLCKVHDEHVFQGTQEGYGECCVVCEACVCWSGECCMWVLNVSVVCQYCMWELCVWEWWETADSSRWWADSIFTNNSQQGS